MVQREIVVNQPKSLKEIPTFLIKKANEFKSFIWIEKDDNRADAKSLLGLLSLGIDKGSRLRIIADGVDEQQAVTELTAIAENFNRM